MKKFILLSIVTLFISYSAQAALSIESKDITEGKALNIDQVYNRSGCFGRNRSPEIIIKDIPTHAKSLAVTAYDPDAPSGSGWWHWIVYNIPTSITKIQAGDKSISSKAIFGRNDYGNYEFGGACPPIGDKAHKYIFTVYALSVDNLKLPKDAPAAMIGFNLNANAIEKYSIETNYERKQ